jgi:hypothetical protein
MGPKLDVKISIKSNSCKERVPRRTVQKPIQIDGRQRNYKALSRSYRIEPQELIHEPR